MMNGKALNVTNVRCFAESGLEVVDGGGFHLYWMGIYYISSIPGFQFLSALLLYFLSLYRLSFVLLVYLVYG